MDAQLTEPPRSPIHSPLLNMCPQKSSPFEVIEDKPSCLDAEKWRQKVKPFILQSDLSTDRAPNTPCQVPEYHSGPNELTVPVLSRCHSQEGKTDRSKPGHFSQGKLVRDPKQLM